ncbi:MAG TPA: CPBP family intramembrane glutamic endopeptidase [Thermoanaerobaculia bacterium]|nr:CPBP family intramembrane glutamic endopeptidase [Thermoanaerobaculia bacterium]
MKRIAELSDRVEFWLICTLAFGLLIVGSTRAFLTHKDRVLDDHWAAGLLSYELAVIVIVVLIGRARGWSLADLGLHPSLGFTGWGVLLYIAGMVTLWISYAIAVELYRGDIPHSSTTAHGLSLVAVVAVAVVNSVFEETLVTGYIVRATLRHGAVFAVTASTLVRFLYHTYQGPVDAVCILPLGLLYATVYLRSGELWPLVTAHALMDLVALGRRI